MNIEGMLNVNKPEGITSYDVIRLLKKKLGMEKIGHCGTLDPIASGVLPVLFGRTTKLFDSFIESKKVYRTKIVFGFETDTGDRTGRVIKKNENPPQSPFGKGGIKGGFDEGRIREVIKSFVGEIEQVAPMYSALNYKGRKLYELARAGKIIPEELRRRKVKIHEINLVNYKYPCAEIYIECSKGTYIRSLVIDLGRKLNCFATVSGIVRERTGTFDLDSSVGFDKLKDMTREDICKKIKSPSVPL